MLDISWVDGQIAVGPAFDIENIPELKNKGIMAVIDFRSEAVDDRFFASSRIRLNAGS